MADVVFAPLTEARLDWPDGEPWATSFNDCYFSAHAGAAEAHYVFVQGNQLATRFSALPNSALFTIGETGFGTGLNFLEVAQCFLDYAPADAQLYFISCEKHPLNRADLARAHQLFPQHAALAAALQACYPPACPGFHWRIPHPRIRLLLLYGDAAELLPLLDAGIDAWFLDGFAPAKNPDFWQPVLFDEIARHARPGATLATFTAAGQVRRDLQHAGFSIEKQSGFGQKRDMLTGTFPGYWQAFQPRRPHVAIIGAGLAGTTTARALAEAGCTVQLFDGQGIAQGASGNLAGTIYVTPSANFNTQNRFYQTSFLTALHWLKRQGWPPHPEQGRLNGIVQLPCQPRLTQKQQAALASGYWPAELMQQASAEWPAGSVHFPGGGYLNPPTWCHHLVNHPNITFHTQQVQRLTPQEQGWQLLNDHQPLAHVDAVVLANAAHAQDFIAAPLPIKHIRGQVSYVRATPASLHMQHAICHQGYISPAINGVHCVGATFDLHDLRPLTKAEDDVTNLQQLHDWLPDVWEMLGGEQMQVVSARAGLRCLSKDFMPLVGHTSQAGLFLNIAHGSRGLTTTPLSAELLVSQLTGSPCPTDRLTTAALHPLRTTQR